MEENGKKKEMKEKKKEVKGWGGKEGGWPERPDYYDAHPRPGFAMPMVP